jgi:hypothetical protein
MPQLQGAASFVLSRLRYRTSARDLPDPFSDLSRDEFAEMEMSPHQSLLDRLEDLWIAA